MPYAESASGFEQQHGSSRANWGMFIVLGLVIDAWLGIATVISVLV
jgi:hypothetical protein